MPRAPGRRWRQIGWFCLLWAGGVASLALIGSLIKLALAP